MKLVTGILFCPILVASTYAQVGIGTVTPEAALEVIVDNASNFATVKATGDFEPTNGYLGVQGEDDYDTITTADWNGEEIGVVGISAGTSTTDNVGVIGHSNGTGIRAEHTTGNNRVELATTDFAGIFSGRVAIPYNSDATGTTDTGVLEIDNSLRIDNNEIITNDNTILYLQNDNNGDLAVDGTTLRVDASTNRVGIGTTIPGTDLEIRNPATHARITLNGNANGATTEITFEENDGYEGAFGFQHLNDYMFIYHGHGTNQNGVMVQNGGLAVGLIGGEAFRANGRIQSRGNVIPYFDNSFDLGTSDYRWDDVYATNGTIQTSDIRDKENIQPVTYGLKEILEIEPIKFQWKNHRDPSLKLGFSAQQLQTLIPEVVKDYDYFYSEGNDTPIKKQAERLGVYYSDIIPVLVNAIKEQQEMIETLNNKLAEVEALAVALKTIKQPEIHK